MQNIFCNKKVLLAAIGVVVIIIVLVVLAIVLARKDSPEDSSTNFTTVSVETDPVSGVEIETTNQAPEIITGPMFLGFEDLYRNRSGDWVNNSKETIKRFAAAAELNVERVSVAAGSFNGTGANYDPLTSTSFYFVINNSGETYKLEAKTLPGAEYSYDIYNQAGERLFGEVFKTTI